MEKQEIIETVLRRAAEREPNITRDSFLDVHEEHKSSARTFAKYASSCGASYMISGTEKSS